jgi:hypothetical protein
MSYNIDTKSSISNENSNLIQYLIRKLESRKSLLYNIKEILNSINSINDFLKYKIPTINFLEEINEDFKQAIFAIKALFTENKALSLSNDAQKEKIDKQKTENAFLFSENEDLKKSINEKFENKKKNNNLNSKSINDSTERNAINFSNAIKNIENNKIKLKNAVKLHFNKNKINANASEIENETIDNNIKYNCNQLLMKKFNEKKQISKLTKKINKNLIKSSTDTNYHNNLNEKIINNNERDYDYKITKNSIKLKNNLIDTPKIVINDNNNLFLKNKSYENQKSRNKKIIDERKKTFDNVSNSYINYFDSNFLNNHKNNCKIQKTTYKTLK